MDNKKESKTGLRLRLLRWFLLISFLPLFVVVTANHYLLYFEFKKVAQKALHERSQLVSSAMNSYFVEVFKDLTIQSELDQNRSVLVDFSEAFRQSSKNIKEFVGSEAWLKIDRLKTQKLKKVKKILNYEDVFLVSAEGDVLFSVLQKRYLGTNLLYGRYSDTLFAQTCKKVLKEGKPLYSDLEDYGFSKDRFVGFVVDLLLNEEGKKIGLIAFQFNVERFDEIIRQEYEKYKTMDSFLVGSDLKMRSNSLLDKETVVMTNLKGNREVEEWSAHNVKNKFMGEEKDEIYIGRRGFEVLGAHKNLNIAGVKMGIISEIDSKEIFGIVDTLRYIAILLGSVVGCIVILIAVIASKSIVKPLQYLTRVSEEFSLGKRKIRIAKVETNDEIQNLAKSFNRMIDSLEKKEKTLSEAIKKLTVKTSELEKTNLELDSFVYTASHDLRAPLRGIGAFAGFLMKDYRSNLGAKGTHYLERIIKGTERMSKLIDDLLALSRIARLETPYELTDINEVLKEVQERIEYDIAEGNVHIVVQSDMPSIICSRIKMSEVFLNLINNAIKFSSKVNENVPEVKVGYRNEEEHCFFVQDNGIGIDPKYHEQIFGTFKRLHDVSEYEGTGAGLSIVKRVIDDHRGRIWIESELGKGSTFLFTVPKNIRF